MDKNQSIYSKDELHTKIKNKGGLNFKA